MKNSQSSAAKRFLHHALRKAFSVFPRSLRFAVYRSFVDCDPKPDKRLVLKIAQTKEELEACFRLLHDAYVGSGFMRPDPSGMRATIYHALPTTTTLCAKFDGEVVGTISLIRESVFGFPLQSIFDLHDIREKKGRIAEVSALAVHPKFRKTGGSILFPLMKFMYEYCTTFFDTRHQKWPRLFEQLTPSFKWTLGGLPKVQSCPRRRASLATNAKPRWATRGAPGISFYAASASFGSRSS